MGGAGWGVGVLKEDAHPFAANLLEESLHGLEGGVAVDAGARGGVGEHGHSNHAHQSDGENGHRDGDFQQGHGAAESSGCRDGLRGAGGACVLGHLGESGGGLSPSKGGGGWGFAEAVPLGYCYDCICRAWRFFTTGARGARGYSLFLGGVMNRFCFFASGNFLSRCGAKKARRGDGGLGGRRVHEALRGRAPYARARGTWRCRSRRRRRWRSSRGCWCASGARWAG